MALSLKAFQMKIRCEFLKCKDKSGLFRTLRAQLRAYLRYPDDYIMYFLEMLSEPMPLHAAVSAGYFRQHGCLPDRLPLFMAELRDKCGKNFLTETESSEPDLQKCAGLHTAFSYLNPEYAGTEIPEAVEKLSEAQKTALFQEVGRCIHIGHDITQEERDLLDPVLKYFSLHYPEEINNDFLEKNQERFSGLIPRETTLSELFISAVKKQHFSYFRILYALFPGWHMNQNEITSAEWTAFSFAYADSAEHLLDSLYIALQLAKEGHSRHNTEQIRDWYQNVMSYRTEFPVQQVLSYLRDAYCIESEPERLAEFVHAMPYYEPDALFSEILPAQRFPVGGIFVQQNTETILKHDSSLLKEYLSKIGKNNIWHFETDLDCPDAEPTEYLDYAELITNTVQNHTAEEILYFYFNTHLRKFLPVHDLKTTYYSKETDISDILSPARFSKFEDWTAYLRKKFTAHSLEKAISEYRLLKLDFYTTFEEWLCEEQPELTAAYLDAVQTLNPYHKNNGSAWLYSTEFFKNRKDRLGLLKKIIRKYSPEIIARIYADTNFRLEIPLNDWLSLAEKNGKLPQFLHYLQNFKVRVLKRNFPVQFNMKKIADAKQQIEEGKADASRWYRFYQNIQTEKFSADGVPGENILPAESELLAQFQITGYQAEQNTVLLMKIKNAENEQVFIEKAEGERNIFECYLIGTSTENSK